MYCFSNADNIDRLISTVIFVEVVNQGGFPATTVK
jgi:hypothetical protein